MDKKEIYGIIYVIRNKVNNKLYIGQTTNKKGFKGRYHKKGEGIERVYESHLYERKVNKSYNEHLLNSIEKYGFNAFEVIEEFDVAYSKEELDKLEDMYIKIYNTIDGDCGYNNKYGGSNGNHTQETKAKLSEINKGRTVSEGTRQKLREAFKGDKSFWWGKKHTTEELNKMSEALKGENNPMYGAKGELNPFFGKHHTEETKDKIRKKNSGRNSSCAKAVYCYELDEIRLCAKEWIDELKLSNAHISACCKGKRKSTGGYHFRYATEEEIKEYKLKHGID